ncbi:MAG: hypothetical protein HPY82_05765 [Gammaproteobacteria bacterium]|nr:hypothetical protein [Gammaproteobacteria bacterium]
MTLTSAKSLLNFLRVVAIAGAPYAIFSWGHYQGAKQEAGRWEAEKAEHTRQLAESRAQNAENVPKVITEYVDRVQLVREKAKTIVKEVPIYVPSDAACDLPGGFRVFHDATASGDVPDPARIADAAPVEVEAVAATVAENYSTCHEISAQLISLQKSIAARREVADAE